MFFSLSTLTEHKFIRSHFHQNFLLELSTINISFSTKEFWSIQQKLFKEHYKTRAGADAIKLFVFIFLILRC